MTAPLRRHLEDPAESNERRVKSLCGQTFWRKREADRVAPVTSRVTCRSCLRLAGVPVALDGVRPPARSHLRLIRGGAA